MSHPHESPDRAPGGHASGAGPAGTRPAEPAGEDRNRPSLLGSPNVAGLVATVLTTFAVLWLVAPGVPWPVAAREYLEAFGRVESGATNLVSAIYLGYRAFDTLGETIVLLSAIAGTTILAGVHSGDGAHAAGIPHAGTVDLRSGPIPRRFLHRTDILGLVTGKLGPLILIFGAYVMIFGHLSPGGGFQGGVVIASGIVFLSLGSRGTRRMTLIRPETLVKIESVFFLFLFLACLPGMFAGTGFLGNPSGGTDGEVAGAFIVVLNIVIGVKVGAGVALMCIEMNESRRLA